MLFIYWFFRVFMKLCTFLKSHLESVRRTARQTLEKIMSTLGPKYLGLLLGEMVPLLSRGFEVHVLVYTIHSILNSLKSKYQPGDLDKVLLTVIDVSICVGMISLVIYWCYFLYSFVKRTYLEPLLKRRMLWRLAERFPKPNQQRALILSKSWPST